MRKLLSFIFVLFVALGVAAQTYAADSEDAVRECITDVLYEYKDVYNLRNLEAVRSLYTDDALIMSFACRSKNEVLFSDFSERLPRCASYWVEGGFKLRLFKITNFKVDDGKCSVRVLWDYRDNKGRGKFHPTFEFALIDGEWKILKETYGRKPL